MKFINKILIVALVWSISACDMTELDLLDSPNEVTPENASVNDLYNNVQLQFENFINNMWYNTASISRMISNTSAYDYSNATNPNDFNGLWYLAYANMYPDIDLLIPLAEELGLDVHVGSAKIIKAYTLTALADLFGKAPLADAGKGTEVQAPTSDDGEMLYAQANTLLDEAITQLSGASAPAPTNDLIYGGSAAKWVTAAKTLKLRNAVTTRLAGGAGGTVSSLIAEGDLIDEASEDFQFNYGSTRTNPASRHPRYYNSYEATDGDYMSNYYMWLMKGDKQDADGNVIVDPRIRYYFYRQVEKSAEQDVNAYACHFSNLPDQSAKPPHYDDVDPRLPYCIATTDGYYGRDHLNNEGIPPDGPIRTVYGLYPAGGQFDDNSFQNAQQGGTTGGLGQGIQPIMLASFADFLRAEAALTMSTGEDAKALLESGIRKSMAKVKSFESLVPTTLARQVDVRGELVPVADLYVPDEEDIDAYVAYVMDEYDAASDKLNIVMREYYIALWGNGLESYNNWRRTGKPNNMAPSLEPGPGTFIRSFFLPADHVNFNQNATQKGLGEPVFWDTNPDGFAY